MDTAVLQETRNLLNSLNEENAELKSHAEHLTQQWRQAVNELETERQKYAQLEHDSKQINTNLFKQLQALQTDGKNAQSSQDILERRCHAMELQLERLAEDKASAEDRVAALEKNLSAAISREERERREKLAAREEADQYSSELQRKLSSEREKTVASERSLSTRCEELSIELKNQQDLVSVVKKQKESEKNEYERLVHKLRSQLEAANEAASRTRHAEAECTFAHEEVHAVAENFFESLSDLHAKSRATQIDSAEMNNSLSRITDRFRNIALSAAAQKKNSEALISFYSTNYNELKQVLEATVAENNEIRGSVESRVAMAVSDIERRTREATMKKEKCHQEELESKIGELDTRQRERDALAQEVERLKEALQESHESEKQLRAFSEQLYAEVVGANKVASEAAEKERSAKSELTTLEHRVSEKVRKDLITSFEQEKSKMIRDFNQARTEYELEITELKAQLDENTSTLENALKKIMKPHQYHHQQQQGIINSSQNNSTSRSQSAATISNNNNNQQQQQPSHHRHFNPHQQFSASYRDHHQQDDGEDILSPQTPSVLLMTHSNQKRGMMPSTTRSTSNQQHPQQRYSVDIPDNTQQQQKKRIGGSNSSSTRGASQSFYHQQAQQQQEQEQEQEYDDVDYQNHYQQQVNHDEEQAEEEEEEYYQQQQQQQRQQYKSNSSSSSPAAVMPQSSSSAKSSSAYHYSSSSLSPARNAAGLPQPASRGSNIVTKNIVKTKRQQQQQQQQQQLQQNEDSSSPSQLRWPPKTSLNLDDFK